MSSTSPVSNSGPPAAREDGKLALGAYGYKFLGIRHQEVLFAVPDELDWPTISLRHERRRLPDEPTLFAERRGVYRLGPRFHVQADRVQRTATLFAPLSDDDVVIRPFLEATAITFSYWRGLEAFHGGAFIGREGAWAVFGEKTAGKSSTLASVALAGHRVLADDLLVVNDGQVFAGPRCIDLRPDIADHLCVVGRTRSVGGERRRLLLDDVVAQAPLRGSVFLSWGPELELRRVPPGERLARLAEHRSVVPSSARALLELVGRPAWELCRPRRRASLSAAVELLLDAAA